jgi:ribonuclease HI
MIKDDLLNIYTDGSSFSGPRVGGIGIRFVTTNELGDEVIEDVELPGYRGATNNQMELYACVAALKEAREYHDLGSVNRIAIHTDSLYIVDNYKSAMFEWSGNRWRNREGRPIANADLWKELVKLIKKCWPLRVDFYWVKGHSKDKHNKAVDKLAKKSAKSPLNKPLTIVNVRRKKTRKSVEIGSVEMRRQRLAVRIITSEYLSAQRTTKYKYEVLSKGSRYFGNVDIIFSNESLKAGHQYEVSVNKNTANPMIMKVLREIER